MALPEPPAWLSPAALEVWDRVMVEVRHMGVLTAADQDCLVIYVTAVVHHEQACRLVDTAGLVVQGKGGQWVKNPAASVLRDQALLVKTMALQLGLVPTGRASLHTSRSPDPLGPERLLS